ncbi:RNA processing factor [Lithospermum erythrorhizon]|uniref:RNA processing factor n=1 Tax=Lithospermum erythrorhizon TaxID=34254 RepID=A0AAV3QJZ8_LITER
MNSLFHACNSCILLRTGNAVLRNSVIGFSAHSLRRTSFQNAGVKTVDLDFFLARFRVQCYASKSKRPSGSSSSQQKAEPEPVMKEEKDAFFVVRKGDLVGVYKTLTECQSQVGTSVCNPPVSVYKGHSMSKDTEEYLTSCGLKNALYSIRAKDLTGDLFGNLVPCSFQLPSSSGGETSAERMMRKRSHDTMWSEYAQRSCTLEFDGASKGNPGQAGAGAILRADDGSWTCRLREGLGITTNNVAEYRGMILGLKAALQKGFTSIRVQGDSKLVCMQVQGLWKVKHPNMFTLHEEAKRLKDRFLSFEIIHVLRDLNSEADAQANLALELADGQVEEAIDK